MLTGNERILCQDIYSIKIRHKKGEQVNSYKGFCVDDNFNIYNEKTGNLLTPYLGVGGYMHVVRRGEDGKRHYIRVHTIFANIFIPNPNGYKYVNHIDSNKSNNSLNNLEWCTNSYNVKHGWASGNRTHKNRTGVIVTGLDGVTYNYASIREACRKIPIERHKLARILKGEAINNSPYKFEYMYG